LSCSIWTIDLAHLLRRFGMSVVFTTITVGTNPEYADELFYAENMHADEHRVQQLFLVRVMSILSQFLPASARSFLNGACLHNCANSAMQLNVWP